MRHTLPILIGALLLGAEAGAQAPPRSITFEEAVNIALQRNATLQLAENAAALDAIGVRQARLDFLPSLSANANTGQSYGRTFSEAEGGIVNQTTNSVSGGLSSSVTVFNGFRNLASLRQAQRTEDAGEMDLGRARQTVVFTVASNYLALIQQREQLRVQQENLQSAAALEQQIRAYVDAGVRPIAELYQQQATVAGARASLVEAQRASQLAQVDLMQTLQLDPAADYEFVVPAVETSVPAEDLDLDALLARAFAQRRDLAAESERRNAAEQGVRAAEAGRWPSLALTAGYNTSYSSANDFGFVDQLDQRRGGSIGIGISIPLFDRGATSAATQRAEIQVDNAQLALETRRQEIGLQVRRAYLDVLAAQARLEAAEAQARAAQLALETSEQRYRVGAGTLVELQQARAGHVQAQSALVSARYNLLFQRSLIDYYVGDLDPASISLG